MDVKEIIEKTVDKVKNDVIIATRIEFEDDPSRGGAFYRMELKRKN